MPHFAMVINIHLYGLRKRGVGLDMEGVGVGVVEDGVGVRVGVGTSFTLVL